MESSGDLVGRVAFITGGGSGIGAAVARKFGTAGARVAICGRSKDRLVDVAKGIEADGSECMTAVADVRDAIALSATVKQLIDRFGRLDIVVANAGVACPLGPVLSCPESTWREVLDIDLTGVFLTVKATYSALAAQGGSIIVIGSGAGRVTTAGIGAYSIAKAAVSTLVRLLSLELRESNIAVNELIPGPTRTEALSQLGGPRQATNSAWSQMHEWMKEPDEVARLALFIATLPTSGTSGQVFSLAGRVL